MASIRTSPLTNFLSLAPTTSASYPTNPPALVKTTGSTPAAPEPAAAPADVELKRRSSSMSSNSSSSGASKQGRFLKLGPIHHGVKTGDWSEEI